MYAICSTKLQLNVQNLVLKSAPSAMCRFTVYFIKYVGYASVTNHIIAGDAGDERECIELHGERVMQAIFSKQKCAYVLTEGKSGEWIKPVSYRSVMWYRSVYAYQYIIYGTDVACTVTLGNILTAHRTGKGVNGLRSDDNQIPPMKLI